jgi:hypothetical protein
MYSEEKVALQNKEDLTLQKFLTRPRVNLNPKKKRKEKKKKTKAHVFQPEFALCLRELIIGQQDGIRIDK